MDVDEVEQDQPNLWWRILQYLLVCLVGGIGLGAVMTVAAVVAFAVFGLGALIGGMSAL